MFPPATKKQMQDMGWDSLDVILVTGDAYVDVPHMGVAVIANVLMAAGFRTGVIAQPDMADGADIVRLGEPELFWGVTGGCMDSMVAGNRLHQPDPQAFQKHPSYRARRHGSQPAPDFPL